MYNLTIHFGPNAVAWSFLFKTEEKAGEIYNAYVDFKVNSAVGGLLIGSDDYGQSFALPFEDIHGVLLEELEAGEESRIIRGLSQAKGQMRANKRAQSDPEIQALQKDAQRGPSILTPFTNGGFRPQ